MSGVLKSVKVTVPKLITVTIVCWANTTATARTILYIYIHLYFVIIYSPMIDSTHVLSKLGLDLLQDDLHKAVKVLGSSGRLTKYK